MSNYITRTALLIENFIQWLHAMISRRIARRSFEVFFGKIRKKKKHRILLRNSDWFRYSHPYRANKHSHRVNYDSPTNFIVLQGNSHAKQKPSNSVEMENNAIASFSAMFLFHPICFELIFTYFAFITCGLQLLAAKENSQYIGQALFISD